MNRILRQHRTVPRIFQIDGVRRFALAYFDARGAPTREPAQIASIRIELETGRPGPQAIMASQVMLRNAPIW